MSKFLLMGLVFVFSACATSKPCQSGGEPALDKPLGGPRQCTQREDPQTGRWINNGLYREWYTNGNLGVEGEYKNGLRSGHWFYWDQNGRKTGEKWFDNGVESPLGPVKKHRD